MKVTAYSFLKYSTIPFCVAWFIFWLIIMRQSNNNYIENSYLRRIASNITLGSINSYNVRYFHSEPIVYMYYVSDREGIWIQNIDNYNAKLFLPLSSIVLATKSITEIGTEVYHIRYPCHGYISNNRSDPILKEIDLNPTNELLLCQKDNYLSKTDLIYGDLFEQGMQTDSESECCVMCMNDGNCKGWTYVEDDKLCWLKDGNFQYRHNAEGKLSGVKAEYKTSGLGKASRHPSLNPGSSDLDDMDHGDSKYANSYILSKQYNSLDWTYSIPLGNGKFGGLVGGNRYEEIIPLSIEGYYVHTSNDDIDTSAKSDMDISNNEMYNIYNTTRNKLYSGVRGRNDIMNMNENVNKMVSKYNKLGMFQYACDVTMLYSIFPITINSNNNNIENVKVNEKNDNQNKLGKSNTRKSISRKIVNRNNVNEIKSSLNVLYDHYALIDNNDNNRVKLLYYSNILNTIDGISNSIYVTQYNSNINNNSSGSTTNEMNLINNIYVYERKWFVSVIDSVIIGRIKCYNKLMSCTNIAFRMSRFMNIANNKDVNLAFINESNWEVFPASSSDFPIDLSEKYNRNNVIGIQLYIDSTDITQNHINNGKNQNLIISGVLLCINVHEDEDIEDYSPDRNKAKIRLNTKNNKKSIVCNNADEFQFIGTLQTSKDSQLNKMNKSKLKHNSWSVIESALRIGVNELEDRHKTQFRFKMLQSEINFQPDKKMTKSTDKVNACVYSTTIAEQLACYVSHADDDSNLYTNIMNSIFWYNKYVLLSSSLHSVNNLQGLWANGPSSAWSGDYHININLQMNYWPMNALFHHNNNNDKSIINNSNINSIISYLILFINNMYINGKITAVDMYHCKGWVSHGFIDNLFNTAMNGDSQWSLCVTCGVWLSLHIWEYITYNNDIYVLYNYLLPIFYSTAEFFINYMFLGHDNHMHTGPTTSPENSYMMLFYNLGYNKSNVKNKNIINDKFIRKFSHLAFSPAIDMSILRQAANAYNIAIEWMMIYAHKNSLIDNTNIDLSQLKLHAMKAKEFMDLVSKMSNSALPKASAKTKTIMEYPVLLTSLTQQSVENDDNVISHQCVETVFPHDDIAMQDDVMCGISEDYDKSHRHFSSLHWLYPGTFLPHNNKDTYTAAYNTLRSKMEQGGGHTGWSAAWEGALWARLRNSSNVYNSISKIIKKYTTRNLLGLHPPLESRSGINNNMVPNEIYEDCVTCFQDITLNNKDFTRVNMKSANDRNMQLVDNSKFQIDVHGGMLAIFIEMILQSHIPGLYHLLPSLPKQLQHKGYVNDIAVRGGPKITMSWINNTINKLILDVLHFHPWLLGLTEFSIGYFQVHKLKTNNDDIHHDTFTTNNYNLRNSSLIIASPNRLKYSHHMTSIDCFELDILDSAHRQDVIDKIPSFQLVNSDVLMKITIKYFPCRIELVNF